MTKQTNVIIGASLAGASAAAALRKNGFDGRIVLVGDEAELPYERPALSKEYLRGEAETPVFVQPSDFYTGADIELLLGHRATRIDPAAREVATSAGTFAYDRLLLATGASPRGLDIPGADLAGITTLRTVADADRIREQASKANAIVVVGGGWIGSEVAASLRQLGRDVTLVSTTRTPLEHVLGADVGEVYRQAHEDNGVKLVTEATVTRFAGRGRVEAVETADGRRTPRTSSSSGSARRLESSWLSKRDWPWTQGSSSTPTSNPACQESMPPAMSRRRGTRTTVDICEWSTGTTPSARGGQLPGPWPAKARRTTASRTSTRTSTTSEWSTRDTRRGGTRSCSVAIREPASSLRSGSPTARSLPA
jgi:thioredoxin reductase